MCIEISEKPKLPLGTQYFKFLYRDKKYQNVPNLFGDANIHTEISEILPFFEIFTLIWSTQIREKYFH